MYDQSHSVDALLIHVIDNIQGKALTDLTLKIKRNISLNNDFYNPLKAKFKCYHQHVTDCQLYFPIEGT